MIGINAYQKPIPVLRNAVDDARAVATLLAAYGFDPSDIIEVIDQQATLERLRRLFEHELPERARSLDQLLVYYAGHGHAVPDRAFGVRGFLVPVDAIGGAVDSFLPTEVVRNACDALSGCNHLLLLLDCRFAGSFGSDVYKDVGVEERLARRWFESYERRRSFQLIASCAHDERALDSFSAKQEREQLGGQHSPFARTLLDALGDKLCADVNGDFIVTTGELFSYFQTCFAAPGHRGLSQTPNLWHLGWHQGGEFMFVAGEPRFLEPAALAHDANPYRGLKAFRASHRKLFFGRTGLSDQLCARVRTHPLTEELVTARAPDAERGLFLLLVELAAYPGSTEAEIESALAPAAAFITQLEAATRSAFWRTLNALVARRTALRIVATARSEYEPHFLRKVEDTEKMPGPTAAWQRRWIDARFWVRRMHREELRECIERPAARMFLRFEIEPRPNGTVTLVDQLLDEVDQMPGGLPLLSVALREMFAAYVDSKRCDATIGWEEYDRVGGATGALHRRADQIYSPAAMSSDRLERDVHELHRLHRERTRRLRQPPAVDVMGPKSGGRSHRRSAPRRATRR